MRRWSAQEEPVIFCTFRSEVTQTPGMERLVMFSVITSSTQCLKIIPQSEFKSCCGNLSLFFPVSFFLNKDRRKII